MTKINKLNEDIYYTYHTELEQINEMAKIEKLIMVHNEKEEQQDSNELKFAHFHYLNIHFRFSKNLPKNATQLRKLIAFSKEQKMIEDHEVTKLAKLLSSKPSQPKFKKFKTVYDLVMMSWCILNPEQEMDYIEDDYE